MASVQADLDDDVRREAQEGLVVEAARTRLVDRTGQVRVLLRSGRVVAGTVDPSTRVDGHLAIAADDGTILVAVAAVVCVTGSRPGLRDEEEPAPERLSRWARQAWSEGRVLRVLDSAGSWHVGSLTWVGSDHVALGGPEDGRGPVVIPLGAVEAWRG